MILVDTSIWVRFFDLASPHSDGCRKAVGGLTLGGVELCICAQVMIEYWAVATRPLAANGLGVTHEVANLNLSDILNVCTLLTEPPDIAERWRTLANQAKATGKSVHDLRIAALMQAFGVTEILTLNGADFERIPGLRVLLPT